MWDKQLNVKWSLVNVYGPPQDEDEEFLCELAAFCSDMKEPYILGGDFNIIRFAYEKNKNFQRSRFSDLFNTVIHANDLREIYMAGGKYTWSNNQENPTLERLDRILMSREWENLFPTMTSYKNPREVSDHNPIILTTCGNRPKKKLEFRFELSWLNQPDFLENVDRIWKEPTRDTNSLDKVQFKLKKIKKFFKGWGFNLAGSVKKKKNEIHNELAQLERLEEDDMLTEQQRERKCAITVEFLKILEEEELYWFKRSHETWLLKGDNNTEFFHRIANGEKRKSTIFSLQDGENAITGDEALLKHATEYYKTLFGPGEGNNFELDPNFWLPCDKVNEIENEDLVKPFEMEEIKKSSFHD